MDLEELNVRFYMRKEQPEIRARLAAGGTCSCHLLYQFTWEGRTVVAFTDHSMSPPFESEHLYAYILDRPDADILTEEVGFLPIRSEPLWQVVEELTKELDRRLEAEENEL